MVPGVLILSVFSKTSHILGLIRIRLLDTAYRNIIKKIFLKEKTKNKKNTDF